MCFAPLFLVVYLNWVDSHSRVDEGFAVSRCKINRLRFADDLLLFPSGLRSRRFMGGVGFLTTLGVGVGFFRPTSTPDVQLDHFLHHTPKLGIPVEMVQFLAVYHDFH